LKSPNIFFIWYLGNLSNMHSISSMEAVLHIISFVMCWSMNIQNNGMKPVTSQYYV
jgi:hypothetical protein